MKRSTAWPWLAAVALGAAPAWTQDSGAGTQAQKQRPVEVLSKDRNLLVSKDGKTSSVDGSIALDRTDHLGTSEGKVAQAVVERAFLLSLKSVKVGAGRGVTLEWEGDDVVMRVHKGEAAGLAGILAPGTVAPLKVRVATPHGTAEVADIRSSVFVVEVDAAGEQTKVTAVRNPVTFRPDQGDLPAGEVPPGTSATTDGKKPPVVREEAPPAGLMPGAMQNLLRHGDFESNRLAEPWVTSRKRLPGEKPTPLARITWKPDKVRSGNGALRLDLPNLRLGPDTENVYPPVKYFEPKKLKPGATYLLSLSMLTEGYQINGAPSPVTVAVNFNADGSPGNSDKFACPAREGVWQDLRFIFTARNDLLQFFVSCGYDQARFSGTIWLDDCSLQYLADPPR